MLCRSWPLDAAVVAARSTADGMAAWAAQQIRELQQLLSQGLDADERDSEIWRRLERVSRCCVQAQGKLQGCSGPLSAGRPLYRRGRAACSAASSAHNGKSGPAHLHA